jgi:hypothetical protein
VSVYTYSAQYKDACQAKKKQNNWNGSECCMPRTCFHMPYIQHPLSVQIVHYLVIVFCCTHSCLVYMRNLCLSVLWLASHLSGWFLHVWDDVNSSVSLWFSSVRQMLRLYLIPGHDYICILSKSYFNICHLLLTQLSVISHVFEVCCLLEVFCYLKQFLQFQQGRPLPMGQLG